MEKIIAMENGGQSNVRTLYHGTGNIAADSITLGNFDDRYFSSGAFGYGGYFAEDPNYSVSYTKGENVKNIFIC